MYCCFFYSYAIYSGRENILQLKISSENDFKLALTSKIKIDVAARTIRCFANRPLPKRRMVLSKCGCRYTSARMGSD